MVLSAKFVPLFIFAAETKDWQHFADEISSAAVIVRLSGEDDLFCQAYFIWTETATVFLLSRVQIDTKLVFVTKILVPRKEEREKLPDESSISSQEGKGVVKCVADILAIHNL